MWHGSGHSGPSARLITVPSPSFTPSTSMKTSSRHWSAAATAAAVSSPLTLRSESSPSASVGMTRLLAGIEDRIECLCACLYVCTYHPPRTGFLRRMDCPKNSDRRQALPLKFADERCMNPAKQRSCYRCKRGFIRYAQSFDENRLHVHSFEHSCDLNSATMNESRAAARELPDRLNGPRWSFQQHTADFYNCGHRSPAAGLCSNMRFKF